MIGVKKSKNARALKNSTNTSNMNSAIKEYVEAHKEWVSALNEKINSDTKLEKARHRFNLARAELRAEEQEMITAKVII